MTEEQENIDWRKDVTDQKEILKLEDGDSEIITFKDNGVKNTHPDYGTSIIFAITHKETEKVIYVKATNFSLLRQIKELGTLKDLKVKYSRTGSKRSDTRYTIEKVD